MGEEKVGPARCAERRIVDARGLQSRLTQLLLDRSHQVQAGRGPFCGDVSRWIRREELQRVRGGSGSSRVSRRDGSDELIAVNEASVKRRNNFLPDTITARAHTWSDSGDQGAWFGVECCTHDSHNLCRKLSEHSPPTRMDGGYSALAWIDNQNRQTIRRSYAEQQIRPIGDERISRREMAAQFQGGVATRGEISDFAGLSGSNNEDVRGMHLPERGEIEILRVNRLREPSAILFHAGAVVGPGETQVKSEADSPAYPAVPGAECMKKPVFTCESCTLQPVQSVVLSIFEGHRPQRVNIAQARAKAAAGTRLGSGSVCCSGTLRAPQSIEESRSAVRDRRYRKVNCPTTRG